MPPEIEAKFLNIDKKKTIKKLKNIGAYLIDKEFTQERVIFSLPNHPDSEKMWLRIRKERKNISLSVKSITGDSINSQEELSVKVDNFEACIKMLSLIGCKRESFQENKREVWQLNNSEITLNTWPFLPMFMEIEADSEKTVKYTATLLGFNFKEAVFGSVSKIYKETHGILLSNLSRKVGDITFKNIKLKKFLSKHNIIMIKQIK